MKVDESVWIEKMTNLNERRKREVIRNVIAEVDNYCAHVNSTFIGKKVLDVGCGLMIIKNCLPSDVEYVGIDPFPIKDGSIEMAIEDCTFKDKEFETVYCFAMLDNVRDLKQAIEHIKRICSKNVVILTGINIPPDKYHTIELNIEMLDELFYPFTGAMLRKFHEKIILIQYESPEYNAR
jgi:ubiquinone/menaquinone biosynthesis C-methylase UbiE